MGGINETNIPKTSDPSSEKVRSHLDTTTGHVHFHDENVKPRRTVAIPVSLWHKVSEELLTVQKNHWEYLDPVNQTFMEIGVQVVEEDGKLKIKSTMTIRPVEVDETFKGLYAVGVTKKSNGK